MHLRNVFVHSFLIKLAPETTDRTFYFPQVAPWPWRQTPRRRPEARDSIPRDSSLAYPPLFAGDPPARREPDPELPYAGIDWFRMRAAMAISTARGGKILRDD